MLATLWPRTAFHWQACWSHSSHSILQPLKRESLPLTVQLGSTPQQRRGEPGKLRKLPLLQALTAPLSSSEQAAAFKSGFSCQGKPHRARRTLVNSKQRHQEINENGRGAKEKISSTQVQEEVKRERQEEASNSEFL